jgi:Immunity protein 8
MITAQVKGIYSTDMDKLELHLPGDPEDVCIWVRAMVGPRGGQGEESFDIGVCTPKWLADRCGREGFVVGRHYLVVSRYDPTYAQDVDHQVDREMQWRFLVRGRPKSRTHWALGVRGLQTRLK